MPHSPSPSHEDAQKRPAKATPPPTPQGAEPAISPPEALQRFTDSSSPPLQPRDVQRLQRTVGNQQVQRLLQARGHRMGSLPIQPRLTVNAPHDPLEEEADAVAQAVASETGRVPSAEGLPLHHASSSAGVRETPLDVEAGIEAARGGGQPLAEEVQAPMEQAMGADFSGVRVHTDPQADQVSRSLNAHAFTTGEDLFFRDGAFRPQSDEGKELLAHELAHVVQQKEPTVQRRIQRRIDQTPERYFDNLTPGHIVALQGLTTYAYMIPVNSRGQTFEAVVTEFLAIFPQENDVQRVWGEFQQRLPAKHEEALACLTTIANRINHVVKQHPSYPNQVQDKGVGSEHEDHAHSVPQSERSTELVGQLYQALKDADVYKEKHDDMGQRTGEPSGYMIGVMIGVDGEAYAACSGSPPHGFKAVVERLGMSFVAVEIDAEQAKQRVLTEAPHPVTFGAGTDKHRVHDPKSGEMGPTIGQCAAPKLLQALINRGITQGTTPLSLTEMWIAPDDTPVKIPNDKGEVIRYRDGDIVPSCLSCQQLVPLLHETLQGAILASDQQEMEQSEKLGRIKGLLIALHQHMHPPLKQSEESSDSPASLPLTEHSPEIEQLEQELQTFGLLEVENLSLPSLNEAIRALQDPAQMAERLRRAQARLRREQYQQAKKEREKEGRRLEREKQEEARKQQEAEELRLWQEEQEQKKQEEQAALERRQKQLEEREAAKQRKQEKAQEQRIAREQKKRERAETKQKQEQEQGVTTDQPQGEGRGTSIAMILFGVALVMVFLSFLPTLLGNKEQG